MEYLYSKVEICKALQDARESIHYFIIKDDLYGIKVTRALTENSFKNQEVVAKNISANENDVKNLIDSIISGGSDLSQIGYVVDDYKKQFSNKF